MLPSPFSSMLSEMDTLSGALEIGGKKMGKLEKQI